MCVFYVWPFFFIVALCESSLRIKVTDMRCDRRMVHKIIPANKNDNRHSQNHLVALLTSTWSSVSAGGGRTPRRDLMLKGSSFSGNTSLSTPSRVTMNLVFSPLKHNFVTTVLKLKLCCWALKVVCCITDGHVMWAVKKARCEGILVYVSLVLTVHFSWVCHLSITA